MTDPQPPKKRAQTIRIAPADLGGGGRGPQKAYLTVIRGGQDLGVYVLIEEIATLGRCPECTLKLQDLGVSWKHARVLAGPAGSYILEDVGSTNGTRVHGEPLQAAHLLTDGDKIVLGDTVVRFSLADQLDEDFQTEVGLLVGTDPLTGLESKRRFDDALDFAVKVAQQETTTLAVLMMDMDGVKQINDTHGHLFGAHVIGETGRIIAKHLGEGGHATRFGGDEFSAFLPGLDKQAALAAAEAIRASVERAGLEKDGIALKPTISIGLATFPVDAEVALELVARADAALYRAKDAGKNCVST